MRRIIFVCAVLYGANAYAVPLYLGDTEMQMQHAPETDKFLDFAFPDGETAYLNMVRTNRPYTIHATFDNAMYSACTGDAQWIGDYKFIGDCLVDANPNLYIYGTGTMYIDMDITISGTDSATYILDAAFTRGSWFGGNALVQMNMENNIYSVANKKDNLSNTITIGGRDNIRIEYADTYTTMYINDLMANRYAWSNAYTNASYKTNVCIMHLCYTNKGHHAGNTTGRVYRAKLYVNGALRRHLVPVPADMQIGEFTTPSVGMFDIVEQKFYPNAGTGAFTYGAASD